MRCEIEMWKDTSKFVVSFQKEDENENFYDRANGDHWPFFEVFSYENIYYVS